MRALLQRLKPDLLVALGLGLLPLLFFWPVTLGARTLLPADNLLAVEPWRSAAAQLGAAGPAHNALLSDLVLENYLWKKFILESLRAGELPLWNPYLFAGLPFLAAGQHAALYPFSIIYYLAPLERAYGLFTVSQFFLAGLFTYIFLRQLGLSRTGSAFGALVYQFSLFMVVSVVFPMIVAGAVWLPLILTAVDLIVTQRPALGGRPATLPWLVLGACALGVQVLAGHVEITYYTLLVAGAYSAWRLLTAESKTSGQPQPSGLLRRARRAGALLMLAVFGIGLGAIQLVPLYELVRSNFRSGSASFAQILGWAYPIRRGLALLIPNFFGNPSHHGYLDLFTGQWTPAPLNNQTIDWGIKNFVEGGAYVGLLPILLAALAVGHWLRGQLRQWAQHPPIEAAAPSSRRTVPFFTLLAFFSLAFTFGTPLYALIFWLPGINQLHSPFRWVWPLSLCAAVLSAYGIERVRQSPSRPARGEGPGPHSQHRLATLEGAPLAARLSAPLYLWGQPAAVSLLGGLAAWTGLAIAAALVVARLGYQALGVDSVMDRLVRELALADRAFSDGRMFFSYEARWIFIFALLLIASGLVLRLSQANLTLRGRPIWGALALGVLSLDLLGAGWGFNPAADPALLAYVPPSAEFLQQDTGLWRFTSYDTAGCRPIPGSPGQRGPCKPYNANLGWYFNFEDVRGYDSIFPMQYRRYMELIQPQYELEFNRIAPISDPVALDSPLLDLLNVKYVITEEELQNPKFTLVYAGEVRIYRNETVMPRAFTQPLTATLVAGDFGAAIQTHDPRQHVIVAEPPRGLEPAAPAAAWPAPIPDADIRHTPNEVTIAATAPGPAWLVLADSYFPGWKAFVRPQGAGEGEEREAAIHLVNGNFRGVLLEPGEWVVRFKYTPDSVKLGGIISFIAGVTLLFGLGVWAWRFFYQESAVDSTARRVAKNSLAPMALNLMNRGIDLAFAAFYLRVLGPQDVGKYYFAVVVFGWFEIITNYGLNTLLTRDVSRDRAHANRYLINTTLLRLLLGLVAIPALAGLLGLRQLLPNPLTPDTLWAIGLLVVAQAPASISTGLSALFYVYEKAEYPAAVATISTLVRVALSTIALVLGWGFVGLAGVSIVVNLVTLAILAVLVWRLFLPAPVWELDWGLQRHAVRESFPLMLNHLLATLFFKVDVPLLETIRNQQQAGRGDREVGWYNTAYKFVDAYNIIPAFFTIALFPVMSRQAVEPGGAQALRRTFGLAIKLLVGTALPLAAITTFLATPMVGLLGGQDYLPDGALALSIMVWSIPFGWINSITNYLLIALNQQRGLTRAFAAALLFNVIVNLIFIPRYGYAAAAAITIASELFEGIAFYWYLRRSLGPVPWLGWLWRLWISAAAMAGVMYALWGVQPLLALGAGLAVYALGLAALGTFTLEERQILAGILPGRVRERLGITLS